MFEEHVTGPCRETIGSGAVAWLFVSMGHILFTAVLSVSSCQVARAAAS